MLCIEYGFESLEKVKWSIWRKKRMKSTENRYNRLKLNNVFVNYKRENRGLRWN